MRKINPHNFQFATRSTSRGINHRMALNLIGEPQPIWRAVLVSCLRVRRRMVGILVDESISEDLFYEGVRGRKPAFLHLMTRIKRCIAFDVHFNRTYIKLYDFAGNQVALKLFSTISLGRSGRISEIARAVALVAAPTFATPHVV